MTLNDKSVAGEVIIIQRPHRGSPKIFTYPSINDAFNTWVEDKICRWNSFADFQKNFDGDDDFLAFAKAELQDAEIGPEDPFVEFVFCNEVQYLPLPLNKEDLLHDVVRDDMHAGHVFVSEGESYDEWFDSIVRITQGHNSVSKRMLAYEFYISIIDDLSELQILVESLLEDGEDSERLGQCSPRQLVVVDELVKQIKTLGDIWKDDISLTDEAYEIIESKFTDFIWQL